MITKWRSLLGGLAVGMLLLSLTAESRAQDPDQVQDLAWKLSQEARESWSAFENSWNSGDLATRSPAARELHRSMWDFNRRARLFAQQSRSATPAQLRSQARTLVNEAERIGGLMYDARVPEWIQQEWADVEYPVQNLADFYNLPYDRDRALARSEYGYRGGYEDRRGGGNESITWEGTVDGSDLIHIRGDQVFIDHLAAQPIRGARFNFSSPLPRADVPVSITKLRGRGHVQLVEAPSARNNYTATVRIDDPEGGADSYAFRLSW